MLRLDPFSAVKEKYPPSEFERLGVPAFAVPKMHSSLADKPYLQDRRGVLKQWVYKAFLSRYQKESTPKGTILLFTWVIPGGFGDLVTQEEVRRVLEEAFPEVKIHLITLLEESVQNYPSFGYPHQSIVRFKKEERAPIPKSLLPLLQEASLVLQIPTYYPFWKDWQKCLSPTAEVLSIGEYGFLDTKEFHPSTENFCMGLHALEKGILLPKMPGNKEKRASNYFAYLYSERGFAIYLHAILEREKAYSRDITLLASPPLPLLTALENSSWQGYEIKEIIIKNSAHNTIISVDPEKSKRLIIQVEPFLSNEAVREAYTYEENFVGCRGDRSFSEALESGSFFFYEGPKHALPFLRDLYEIAKYYLFAYPTLQEYLKCLLDTKSDPKALGHHIADLLSYPATWQGMALLREWIKKHGLFDETLKQMVAYALSPLRNEAEKRLEAFLREEISLDQLLLLS
ncbi:MAG: hypothetical protein JSR76_03095 [Verrucomicrobia bacterium]|nr:hypothetical protein [Verrucomicrobiota bacterium]